MTVSAQPRIDFLMPNNAWHAWFSSPVGLRPRWRKTVVTRLVSKPHRKATSERNTETAGRRGWESKKERWQAQQRGAARKSIAETRLKAQLPYFAFGVSVRQW